MTDSGAASLSRLQRRHWVLTALSAAGMATFDWSRAGGILVGGGVIGLSVLLTAGSLRLVLGRRSTRLAIALLFAKLALLLGIGWWAFAAGGIVRPDPIGFALGLTCFPVAAVWEAMRGGK